MDDKDPWNTKKSLGLTAKVLREKKELAQQDVADGLGVSRKRVSEIECGDTASPENLQKIVEVVGAKTLHAMKTLDLIEYLEEEERKPFDPLGPTPRQEVVIYKAGCELVTRFETILRDGCRRQNLETAQRAAVEEWEQLRRTAPSKRVAVIRKNHPSAQTWAFCQFLCAESVRQVVRDPRTAIHVARLALAMARLIKAPWAGRFVAFALAHLANAYRVKGRHAKAERLFVLAHRIWDASPADPGLLDPARIFDLEASLLKDQRRLAESLAVLRKAFPISKAPGRIRFKEALTLSLMGKYNEAIGTLLQAKELLVDRDLRGCPPNVETPRGASPRRGERLSLSRRARGASGEGGADVAAQRDAPRGVSTLGGKPTESPFLRQPLREEAALSYNLGVNLCHLNRFNEAAKLAETAYRINEKLGNRIDILRSFWLQARVLAGLGKHKAALEIYSILRRDFVQLGMHYDVALVTLELAALLLSLNRVEECRTLATELSSFFEAKSVHEEALEAIRIFSESALRDKATEALAREVVRFLYLARSNQGLRFVPATS